MDPIGPLYNLFKWLTVFFLIPLDWQVKILALGSNMASETNQQAKFIRFYPMETRFLKERLRVKISTKMWLKAAIPRAISRSTVLARS